MGETRITSARKHGKLKKIENPFRKKGIKEIDQRDRVERKRGKSKNKKDNTRSQNEKRMPRIFAFPLRSSCPIRPLFVLAQHLASAFHAAV